MDRDETLYGDEPTQPRPRPRRPVEGSLVQTVQGRPVGAADPGTYPQSVPQGGQTRKRVSRRKMIGATAAGVAVLAGGITVEQLWQHGAFAGPLAENTKIGHLLRHAGFGATSDELQAYRKLGFAGAVDQLLNYQQVSEDATEQRLKALNLDLSKPVNQQRWWLLRMAWTQRPLLEKMTLFWHGVLTSSFRKVGGPNNYTRMLTQNQFLRQHAFDSFDNILMGITQDPAMLFYLDLTKSTAKAPNENYARELMELFTLGLGHYTQQDVTQAALALSGWHVKGESAVYLARTHSDDVKTYLGHTGNLDYRDVVRILAAHPATAWFISHKLFSFFVYEGPSTADLQPLVDAYNQSNHNMGAVMRTLLLSPQFSSTKAYRGRVKSPVEFAVGTYRALEIQGNGSALPGLTTLMGQTVLDPPNVAGWPGDKISSLWLNSGTWMTRLNYVDQLLARGGAVRAGQAQEGQPLDLQGLITAKQLDTPEHFVDYFTAFLLDGEISSERRALLVSYFTTPSRSGQTITLTNGRSYPLGRVRGTLYLIMAAPEYQLN